MEPGPVAAHKTLPTIPVRGYVQARLMVLLRVWAQVTGMRFTLGKRPHSVLGTDDGRI